MYSVKAIEIHFWTATIGIVIYMAAICFRTVMQVLMWRAINPDGTLTYTFVESVKATFPFYFLRLMGGLLYLTGMVVMLWNVWKTLLFLFCFLLCLCGIPARCSPPSTG